MENATPLLTALRACTVGEQHEWAALADTTRNYLYQLATCSRKAPGVNLAKRIADASVQMHVKTLGRVPKVTLEQIATMCAI
jgi:hypothetical protein